MAESVDNCKLTTRGFAGNVLFAPASSCTTNAVVIVVNGSTQTRWGVCVSSTHTKYPCPLDEFNNRSNAPLSVNPSQSNRGSYQSAYWVAVVGGSNKSWSNIHTGTNALLPVSVPTVFSNPSSSNTPTRGALYATKFSNTSPRVHTLAGDARFTPYKPGYLCWYTWRIFAAPTIPNDNAETWPPLRLGGILAPPNSSACARVGETLYTGADHATRSVSVPVGPNAAATSK